MHKFISPHRRMKVFGKPKDKKPEWKALFTPDGISGIFITEDDELAERLQNHKEYGKSFVKFERPGKKRTVVHQGERSAGMSQENLVRVGELKASILKKDGSYRKDASEEEIKEYEQLLEGLE